MKNVAFGHGLRILGEQKGFDLFQTVSGVLQVPLQTDLVLLRIASIITLLYFAGHTAGMPWTPAVGPGELPVIEAMKTHHFETGGFTRTYWEFYLGFGFVISAFLLLQAVVLWQLASLARADAVQVRPFVASFFVAFVVNAIVGWKFLFAVPVVIATAIAVCLGLVFYAAGRRKAP